ncbi:hypothetical protein BZK31_25510 [Pseudomonas floridensis]|uniref:DUF1090 domain-containing protein n=1 Tax=Pseudomonas floridensis TaxID=1958950 RepID=A0A1X0MYU9_9PSED|nr:hypothetical protein [Pseudomonas floridensis]ORC54741.1 hypothetical protein BZK31_25510 [Pseudomonas floridensis]
MKRTALTGLFLSAALLASPVFAADDLCAANVQKLENDVVASNLTPDRKEMVEKTIKDAKASQAKGDTKACETVTTKAITALNNVGSGSEGNK